jgi:hypothetical protein
MNRIERIRIELEQLQAATLAARLRQRLQRSPDDPVLRRMLAQLEAARPAPSLPLPALAGRRDRDRRR